MLLFVVFVVVVVVVVVVVHTHLHITQYHESLEDCNRAMLADPYVHPSLSLCKADCQ
jgi:uncharacterized membrane protein